MDAPSQSQVPIKIGVFDSGIGGLTMANAIKKALPEYEIIYRGDPEHSPYGTRVPRQLLQFVEPLLWEMVREGCGIIVIASTTVATTIISELQQKLSVPIIGIPPMLQTAAELTKSRVIAVCSSPTTLNSRQYHLLKEAYAQNITVLEPEARDWPFMNERDPVDDMKIEERIKPAIEKGADVIVIACTHFQWIEEKIRYLSVGKATVLNTEDATVTEVKRVLASLA